MPTVDFEAYLSFDYDGGKPFNVATLLRMEDEASIDVAVVMPANNGPAPERILNVQPDNQRLAEAIAGNPRCVGCATINPTLGIENVIAQYAIMDKYGFGGPKLMGVLHKYDIDDPIVDTVMQRARERNQVVSIHSGPDNVHPNRIARVAARFPDVPIIVDHMGYPDNTEDAIRAAEMHANLYLGTTILRFFKNDPSQAVPKAVADAVRRVGPERVVWGSNLPEYPRSALWCRQAIERLKLGADAERLIFGENLARLYHLG
ncbi:MAG: amidohydrolase [Chloroflexota bacterium]|nr:MAG: amidohydrolase [Chloroflexota bacterium]